METFLKDPFKTFKALQKTIAVVCILIPAVFWLTDRDEYYPIKVTLMTEPEMKSYLETKEVDSIITLFHERYRNLKLPASDSTFQVHALGKIKKDRFHFRTSLSDYAHSSTGYIFGMMYMMAALLYIYNGFVYLARKDELTLARKGPLVNIFIGFSLIGVILHPLGDNLFWHLFFSILFFAGNVFFLLFVRQEGESSAFKRMRIALGIVTILFFLGLFSGKYSVLLAEWLSLAVIASYLFIVAGRVEKK
jgi:hypothetical protein